MTDSESGLPVCEGEAARDFARSYCHLIYNDTQTKAPAMKPKNVILFGQRNAGKSSLINSMAGRNVAKTSSGTVESWTHQEREYSFTLLDGDIQMLLRLVDTVEIEESELDVNTLTGAIEKTQKLVALLKETGGIDLLLFCVKAGRFTDSMQQTYHLFSKILCESHVPLGLVITHLEDEDVMESYWEINKQTFKMYGIDPVAHACIATFPTHVMVDTEKRVEESRRALYDLFHDALGSRTTHTPPSFMRVIRGWAFTFFKKLVSLPTRRMKINRVATELKTHYTTLPRGEARKLGKLIVKG